MLSRILEYKQTSHQLLQSNRVYVKKRLHHSILMVSGRRIGEKEWAKNVPVSTLHLLELANSFGRVLNIRCGF